MTQTATVTAEELVRALKRRKAALPAEIGSFVVLEACEALLRAGAARVGAGQVLISEEGTITLASVPSCPEPEATQALHQVLAAMLVAAGPAPLPALMRLLEKGPTSGRWTLASLRDDLEASLVPLNRKASRRVLARFVREIGWAERAPAKKPTFHDLDSELSSFLGEPSGAPAAGRVRTRAPLLIEPALDDTHEELSEEVEEAHDQVQFFESVRPAAREAGVKTLVDALPPGAHVESQAHGARARQPSEHQPRAPSLRPIPRVSSPPSEAPRSPRSPALIWGAVLLALSAGVVVATVQLRPELLDRLTGGAPEPAPPKQPAVTVKRPAAGDLVVRVATERAQVLRLIGRGPVSVPHLPLGLAHEFVALADGQSPARLLVPKDAEWENTPDGPRYEAAMQLGPGGVPGGAMELGETLLPEDVGAPSDELGTVRIVTTPRGAKVYQLIGFAPEARVESLPLESTQELLIYRKGYAPELRTVSPSDYVDQGEKKRAELEIKLSASSKR